MDIGILVRETIPKKLKIPINLNLKMQVIIAIKHLKSVRNVIKIVNIMEHGLEVILMAHLHSAMQIHV